MELCNLMNKATKVVLGLFGKLMAWVLMYTCVYIPLVAGISLLIYLGIHFLTGVTSFNTDVTYLQIFTPCITLFTVFVVYYRYSKDKFPIRLRSLCKKLFFCLFAGLCLVVWWISLVKSGEICE